MRICEDSVDVLHGALAPHDDTARDTIYVKFRVDPLTDIAAEAQESTYRAGLVFCQGEQESLGVGNAWYAWGYSAFCPTFNFPPERSGELVLNTTMTEARVNWPYLGPRRGLPKTIVVKVEYVPGAADRVTIWLDPDLKPGAAEATQTERIVTRCVADASFDQIRLMHRGIGDGWVFDDLAVANSFEDFVPTPLWRRGWFLTVFGLTLVVTVLGLVVTLERWRARKLMLLVERQQAVAEERMRIAQDLHDDLGARLTEMVLLGEVANKTGPATDSGSLREMLTGLRQLHASMDEAVWSINPRNDSLTHLIEFISEFAQRFTQHAPLAFHLEVAENLPAVSLTASQRHNLLLAVKEALNNAVRHAGATKIRLRVGMTDIGVRIYLIDDGRGMDVARQQTGNGLGNMSGRLEAIGGTTEIRSNPGEGTEVIFTLPLAT